jgi:hypothetical protein
MCVTVTITGKFSSVRKSQLIIRMVVKCVKPSNNRLVYGCSFWNGVSFIHIYSHLSRSLRLTCFSKASIKCDIMLISIYFFHVDLPLKAILITGRHQKFSRRENKVSKDFVRNIGMNIILIN